MIDAGLDWVLARPGDPAILPARPPTLRAYGLAFGDMDGDAYRTCW